MTPLEKTILTYLTHKKLVTDSQLQNQFSVTAGALAMAMRSLKTKLFVEQDGRCYRCTELGQQALTGRQARRPFEGCPAW